MHLTSLRHTSSVLTPMRPCPRCSYSCIFALQASLHDDPAVTWPGLQGHCKGYELPTQEAVNLSATQIFNIQCPELDLGTFYLAAFSWSALIITGLGGTDWYLSLRSHTLTALATALVHSSHCTVCTVCGTTGTRARTTPRP